MTTISPPPQNTAGFTLVEMMIVVMLISVIASIAVSNYETLMAKARYSRTKADMTAIGYAGYVDYTNNLGVWDVSPDPWTPPPSIMGSKLLQTWPKPNCLNYYYSWDNGAIFGLDVVRVSLRRSSDEVAVWSYCVNTFGGGHCDGADIYSGGATPIEITTSTINHFFCTE